MGAKWTPEHDQIVIDDYAAGVPAAVTADRLPGRSVSQVYDRVKTLGLKKAVKDNPASGLLAEGRALEAQFDELHPILQEIGYNLTDYFKLTPRQQDEFDELLLIDLSDDEAEDWGIWTWTVREEYISDARLRSEEAYRKQEQRRKKKIARHMQGL